MTTPYFAAVRKEMRDKGFSATAIDALENAVKLAISAGSTASSGATDITTLQTEIATLQTDVSTAQDDADLSLAFATHADAQAAQALAAVSTGAVWTGPTAPDPKVYPLWWDADSTSGRLKVYYTDTDSSAWVDAFPAIPGPTGATGATGATGSNGSDATPNPQGRLTLVSATPVMTSDQTAKGTIYYTPYVGDQVRIYNGSAWVGSTFTERTLTLNATDNVSGSVYDVFIFNNSGTLTLGTGPAWSSTTARGTGAGTTELQMLNGIWTNKNSIVLKAGGSTVGTVSANQATYLGSFYATANGQTGMAYQPTSASGGTNNILGLYNAYNRVRVIARNLDSTTSWTYNVATWRAANNSNSNRISWLDGLSTSTVATRYKISAAPGASSVLSIGCSKDSTSAAPNSVAVWFNNGSAGHITSFDSFLPSLGFHYSQAMEVVSNTTVGTFFANETSPTRTDMRHEVDLEM